MYSIYIVRFGISQFMTVRRGNISAYITILVHSAHELAIIGHNHQFAI